MRLAKHLSQGKLVYLSQTSDAISVYENKHYRWLSFGDTVQSIMLKRMPNQLTLPHQIALMLPLLLFRPNVVVELGLGGGNLSRFLSTLSSEIELISIEKNRHVIECFYQYFNPYNHIYSIDENDGLSWLNEKQYDEKDWIICDVYRTDEFGFADIIKQLEVFTTQLTTNNCISINLPSVSDDEMNLCLVILLQLQASHQVTYFHIPNYLNTIIHIYPNDWNIYSLLKRHNNTYLTRTCFNRWKTFWKHGISANKC